ncbi:GAF domain-containing protein [Streptomyces sp. ISL-44]|uniref:GAF domain-containing protein n=1 Tax=Streptomyces sp. ISL-44 TaxID=2819184 RepID=UPI0035AB8AA8
MAQQDRDPRARADTARRRVLRLAGLSAAPDPGMDRFARLVARLLRVPAAFVSLAEDGRQILPGMIGLPEPWAGRRALRLSHSLCRYVAASGQPLVVSDVRADERLRTSPVIADLGVVAYAGMPLTDGEGLVLGSLCAIDHEPLTWDGDELAGLEIWPRPARPSCACGSCRRSAAPPRRYWRSHAPPPSGPAAKQSAWSTRPRPVWTTPSSC